MAYNPDLGLFYVAGTVRTSTFVRYGDTFKLGQRYVGGTQAAPIGSPMSGTFTALGQNRTRLRLTQTQQHAAHPLSRTTATKIRSGH